MPDLFGILFGVRLFLLYFQHLILYGALSGSLSRSRLFRPQELTVRRQTDGYNDGMKGKTLADTNPHLRDTEKATRQRIRSVASSTAIETGRPVREIEERIKYLSSLRPRVTLA